MGVLCLLPERPSRKDWRALAEVLEDTFGSLCEQAWALSLQIGLTSLPNMVKKRSNRAEKAERCLCRLGTPGTRHGSGNRDWCSGWHGPTMVARYFVCRPRGN